MLLFCGNEKIVEFLVKHSLTPSEILVLSRINALRDYYESSEKCAEILNLSVISVKRAKAKLLKLGAIEKKSRDASGNHYKVADFLSEKNNENNNFSSEKCDTMDSNGKMEEEKDMVVFTPSKNEETKTKRKKFEEEYKAYMDSYGLILEYAKKNSLRILDKKTFQNHFKSLIGHFKTYYSAETSEQDLINGVNNDVKKYIQYLDSDDFRGGLCYPPSIDVATDIMDKFEKVKAQRDRLRKARENYDPNKEFTTRDGFGVYA